MAEQIKQYWNERARKYPGEKDATTNDIHLRELEIITITETLEQLSIPKSGNLLDVGCGDGYSTIRIADKMPTFDLLGLDYSENMIKNADKRLESHPELRDRVSFLVGDVMELGKVCGETFYDVVLTDRCLINLDSIEKQDYAIGQIAKHTKRGAYYIAIENFIEGQENMNQARRLVGLAEIPQRWHNLYFREREFFHMVEPFFEIIMFKDFSSSYYFATRVIYSKMCQMRGKTPDYNHDIHQLAVHLPWTGEFSPIKMAVLARK